MNALLDKLYSINPDTTSMLVVILAVTGYVFAKTILWWVLFGTGKFLFRKITLNGWINKTLYGLKVGAALVVLNAILLFAFNPDSYLYMTTVVITMLLAARIIWREFFTLGGLLRGDWNPFCPELRFFAWETFNVWIIFKPLKWWYKAVTTSKYDSEWYMKIYRKELDDYYLAKQNGYI